MEEQKTPPLITEKTIDLRKFIAGKNPKMARRLPKFIYNWLNRLLHVDDLNAMLYRNKDAFGIDFADNLLKDFKIKLELIGKENITTDGRYLLAANHPLGGMDGVALISSVGNIRKDILFPVNDVLSMLPNLRSVFVPINKFGSNAANTQNLMQAFAGDKMILYFPAGLCSRKQKGGICDLEWKSTFISQSRKNRRDIIPTHIEAYNSKRFYNIAYWRRKLGLKVNIEQLYLVDEGFKFANKSIRITYGKPIPYTVFDDRYKDKEWAALVKKHVYDLKDNPDKVFNPDALGK